MKDLYQIARLTVVYYTSTLQLFGAACPVYLPLEEFIKAGSGLTTPSCFNESPSSTAGRTPRGQIDAAGGSKKLQSRGFVSKREIWATLLACLSVCLFSIFDVSESRRLILRPYFSVGKNELLSRMGGLV